RLTTGFGGLMLTQVPIPIWPIFWVMTFIILKISPSGSYICIFIRLLVKSLIRFKFVAKFYSITITNPSFALLHQPYLWPNQASFSPIRATHCLIIPPCFSCYTTQLVNGILCMDFGICATISNPSTRQVISLPFPFLKNSVGNYKMGTTNYMIFTLGTKKWWQVHGGPNYFAQRESICISGVIFFRSWMSLGTTNWVVSLVSFDVQTENTFCLIKLEGHLIIVDYRLNCEHYCLPFYVFYYNLSRGNFRRVKIFGLPNYDAFDMSCNDVTVTNYIENILPFMLTN
ncbi:hypothetical protein P3X46_016904, partial [Hevea brasiliensis]